MCEKAFLRPAATLVAILGRLVLALETLVLVLSLPATAFAFRIREAPAFDQTACSWSYGACGDPGTFCRWFTAIVPYWVNEDAAADAGDAGLTQAEIQGAVDLSFQAWEDVTDAILSFTSGGTTPARISGTDGINTTLWFNGDTDPCVGSFGSSGGVLAVTISTIRTTGQVTDVDIVFDSADTWDWSTACVSYDIQSTMTHEAGHMVGFGHTESGICPENVTKPTMCSGYNCDPGVAQRRTLETDDQNALRCLYPEQPTLILMDQTGSMSTGGRMADAQDAANAFVDAFPSNLMAVASFAESDACEPPRNGYELLQDFTLNAGLLHTAINSTSPCGVTPLWESLCCALTDAADEEPSNLLVFTDTEENASDGGCGCTTFDDVLLAASGTEIVVYVIDITNYFGLRPSLPDMSDLPGGMRSDGDSLEILARRTGGLYFAPENPQELLVARLAIQSHLMGRAREHQHPRDCFPEGIAIDDIQRYTQGAPNSPYNGQQVTVQGVVTAQEGPYGVRVMYLEDCSGGIYCQIPSGSSPPLGWIARVTGVVSTAHGEIIISATQPQAMGQGVLPSPPVEYPRTGKQTELVGRLTSFDGFAGGPVVNQRFPLVSDVGAPRPDSLWVFLHPSSGVPPAMFSPGGRYIIQGILMRFGSRNELAPRGIGDVMNVSSTPETPEAVGASESAVLSARPNPSFGRTEIAYTLARPSPVSVHVLDVGGRIVRTFGQGTQPAGRREIHWDGRDQRGRAVPAGIYFVRLKQPDGPGASCTVILAR